MYCVLSGTYKTMRAVAKHLNQPTREFADVEADYCPDEVEVDGFVFVEAIDVDAEEAVVDARHWKDAEALRDYLWSDEGPGVTMCSISIEPHCDDCGYPRGYHAEWCERDIPSVDGHCECCGERLHESNTRKQFAAGNQHPEWCDWCLEDEETG